MKVSSFLALRFLSGKKGSWWLSSFTWMCLAGVIVSVLAFIVVQAVMLGFRQDLQHKVLGFSSHIAITYDPHSSAETMLLQQLTHEPSIEKMYRYLEGEVVLRSEDGESQGIRVRGFEGKEIPQLNEWQVIFEEGEDWSSLSGGADGLPGIILGAELAANMGIVPILQERVELLYPLGDVGPTGKVEPNTRVFRVLGVFKSGYYEYDSKFALTDLTEVRHLLGEDYLGKLGIFLKEPEKVERFPFGQLQKEGVLGVQSWHQMHARLFSALKLQNLGMVFVLILMLILSSFNILSMLMMLVYEKRRDIAVLRALGMTQQQIASLFYRSGLLIGAIGGLFGIFFGAVICFFLSSAKLRLPAMYYLEALPVQLNLWVMVFAFFLAAAMSFTATIFPARQGFKSSIVEALRRE